MIRIVVLTMVMLLTTPVFAARTAPKTPAADRGSRATLRLYRLGKTFAVSSSNIRVRLMGDYEKGGETTYLLPGRRLNLRVSDQRNTEQLRSDKRFDLGHWMLQQDWSGSTQLGVAVYYNGKPSSKVPRNDLNAAIDFMNTRLAAEGL